jgi:hypothetical protein
MPHKILKKVRTLAHDREVRQGTKHPPRELLQADRNWQLLESNSPNSAGSPQPAANIAAQECATTKRAIHNRPLTGIRIIEAQSEYKEKCTQSA